VKRYYFGVISCANYWKLTIIQRGARANLPLYAIQPDSPYNREYNHRIAEGVWESKVAKALYA